MVCLAARRQRQVQTAITNFGGALSQMEVAMEIIEEQSHGHLVAISSISAFRGFPRAMNVYAGSHDPSEFLLDKVIFSDFVKPYFAIIGVKEQ